MSNVAAVSTWDGMPVKSFTDMKTGEMKLYVDAPLLDDGYLLATSTPSNGTAKWKFNNAPLFLSQYNNFQKANGKKPLSGAALSKAWNTRGTKAFNNIRATQLNNPDNYTKAGITAGQRERLQKQHFENSIPGVTDPKTGITVNSDGTKPGEDNRGEQESDDSAGGDGENGDGENNPPLELTSDEERLAADRERGGPRGEGSGRNAAPGKILKYPLEEPGGPFEYDYISITAHDYKPSGLDVIGRDAAYQSGFKNLGPAYERVIFPMQPQLSETNAVNWSDDQLNPVQAILGKAAMDLITTDPGSFDNSFKGIQDVFGNLFDTARDALNEPGVKAAVAAYFACLAVGANLQ